MKTAIIYVSTHHENTKQLVEAIASSHSICLIDGAKEKLIELSEYDCIGFASGIAYGKFYPQILKLMETNPIDGKNVFFLYTCGKLQKGYTATVSELAAEKKCHILGEYGCLGFDTYGPFKLIGGIAKGHPNSDELNRAVEFFEKTIVPQIKDSNR